MKNILVPFDFSKAAANALKYAIKFADNDSKINIYLLHILSGDSIKEEVVSKLNEITSAYNKPMSPKVESIVRDGDLAKTIINIKKELEADLVIMGTSGAPNSEEDDLATRTSKFVQQADLPVLVIPEKTTNFKIKNIILTVGKEKIVDTSPLNLLLDVSRKFNAQVQLLTVQKNEKDLGYSQEDESNENILEYYLEMFYSHHSFAENSDIEKGIREHIKKHKMDMLAVMPRTHSKNGKSSEGRLTKILTLRSDIPLLVLD